MKRDPSYSEQYMNLYHGLGKPESMRPLAEKIEEANREEVRRVRARCLAVIEQYRRRHTPEEERHSE